MNILKKMKWSLPLALVMTLAVVGVVFAAAVLVDTFDNGTENYFVWSSLPISSATYDGAGILGGERDTYLAWSSGTGGAIYLRVDNFDNNVLTFSADNGIQGTATITWDGNDNDATTLAATGLSDANLLSSTPTNDAVVASILGADWPSNIRIRAYEDAGNYGTQTLAIPGGISSPVDIIFLFSNFANTGTGEDFSSLGALELLIDGTVHDSLDMNIDNLEATNARDYGDLPSSFGASITDANHIPQGLRLGASVTVEASSAASANADGDDINGSVDDEDGVTRDVNDFWTPGTSVDLLITVNGCTGTCYLNGWINWNLDTDFSDANEQIFANRSVSNGSNQSIAITVPSSGYTTGDDVYARFRICPTSGGCDSPDTTDNNVVNGEIEDYLWGFGPTAITLSKFKAENNTPMVIAVAAGLLLVVSGGIVLIYKRRQS